MEGTFEQQLSNNQTYISNLGQKDIEKEIEESKKYIEALTKELVLCNNMKRCLKDADDTLIKRKAMRLKNKDRSDNNKSAKALPEPDYGVISANYKKFIDNNISTVSSASAPSKRLFAGKTENVTVPIIKQLVNPIKAHETALTQKINATKNLKNLYTSLLKLVTETQKIKEETTDAYERNNKSIIDRSTLISAEDFEKKLKAVAAKYASI